MESASSVVAHDEDSIYWLDGSGEAVKRVRNDTGEVTVVASGLRVRLPGLAAAGGQVYITTLDPDGPDTGTSAMIVQVNADGGSPVVVAGERAISLLAADATHLYWATEAAGVEQSGGCSLFRWPPRKRRVDPTGGPR
jgi:hypothetical protein